MGEAQSHNITLPLHLVDKCPLLCTDINSECTICTRKASTHYDIPTPDKAYSQQHWLKQMKGFWKQRKDFENTVLTQWLRISPTHRWMNLVVTEMADNICEEGHHMEVFHHASLHLVSLLLEPCPWQEVSSV